jgi:RNA polymerase sigma factor (sigma-70 family)
MNDNRPDPTDAELVIQALQGHKEAFEELVDRYQALALRVAIRLTPTRESAQDLVQETLLEAYLSLGRLRRPERFKSWLLGILLNLGRNRLRRRMHQKIDPATVELGEEAIFEIPDRQPDPDQVAEERELHRTVLAAVETLPINQRQPIWMFYFEALSLQEISLLLGVSLTAVKVRLHRARHSLRQKLEIHFPEFQLIDGKVDRRQTMTRVSIVDVIKLQDKTIILLLNESRDRALPIWIGEFEGASIALGVLGFQTPRPLTFDFISSLLTASNVSLEEVRIETLKSETFYGVVKLNVGDEVREVDARPSDALALAVRTGSPIFVADEIMAQAGKATRPGIAMPEDLREAQEMPVPDGEGMQAILDELKATIFREWPGK